MDFIIMWIINNRLVDYVNSQMQWKLEWTNHAMLTTLQVAWCVTWLDYANINEDVSMTSGTEWCKPMTTTVENDIWTRYLHWMTAWHVLDLTHTKISCQLIWCDAHWWQRWCHMTQSMCRLFTLIDSAMHRIMDTKISCVLLHTAI
jgi:hypothetical protein